MLRGYRNRRGEIDQVLVGPRGLFAVEVKNLNATVLAHRRSRLGDVRQPTVLVGTSAGYLLSLADASADQLDELNRADLQRLIRQDHDFHAKARSRSRGPRPPLTER